MKAITLVGRVENGQITLAENARLPDNGLLYVVVPDSAAAHAPQVASPRLAHPEQAADFELEVVEGMSDAGV
jgi:hypothetical protein